MSEKLTKPITTLAVTDFEVVGFQIDFKARQTTIQVLLYNETSGKETSIKVQPVQLANTPVSADYNEFLSQVGSVATLAADLEEFVKTKKYFEGS